MKEQGFTLIELIVAVAIFAILSFGVIGLVASVFTDSTRQGRSLANADQTRKLSNRLMQELRNATTANNGAYPIATADDQELTFYSNVDSDADIERVRYYVSNNSLYRGVVQPSGSPAVYTGTESSSVVQNDVANGTNPIFYYYDESYDDSSDSALTQPVNIAQITYIRMDIEVLKRTSTSLTDKFSVNAGTALRSLKTNLGD